MMRLFLFLLALAAFSSGCNSNSASGGKKDTVVIRDTVVAPANHAAHAARRDNRYESHAPGSEPASNASNSPDNGTYSPSANQPATNVSQPATPHKKGWSAAAKDAAIGGAAGAAAGAILDKNSRLAGAAIGGALGAGAGYLIGRARDRKTGRVVKHKPTNYSYASSQQ